MLNLKTIHNIFFFHYPTLVILYAIANGLLIQPGSVLTIIIPVLFVLYAVWANIQYNRTFNQFWVMYVYVFYILILVFFSSDVIYSLKNVLKSILPFLYFGLAVTFIKTARDINKMFRVMFILAVIFLVNIAVSNIFNLGGGAYEENEELYVQTGSIYSEGLNSMAYFLLLVPAMLRLYPFKNNNYRIAFIAISILTLILLVLILKRGALSVVISGFIVIFLVSGIRMKGKFIQFSFIALVAMILTYPLYQNVLESRLSVREERLSSDAMETEGRYLENAVVIDDIIYSGNISWFFFGHDVLNSSGNYGDGSFGLRQLHNDYAQILNGSGTVGLSLYLLLNISILMVYIRQKKKLIRMNLYTHEEHVLNALFYAFFLSFFILGASGTMSSMLYPVIRYSFTGAVIGYFYSLGNSGVSVVHSY